ncbi:beta-ketoacyl-ACP synthase III [Pilimelia columellifera]|uniref:Beta-ketoacyl-[acyl-carrier-protein] synthase III n=1 Tax=Pilimelia columellifera subsp. columellifera TaxID=706583 RepID=A0ABP6ABT6_9ACTN
MATGRIVSLGHYQPSKVVTNDDLSKLVDTNDEWILSRVGIASRRIAAENETVADMATAAASKALAASGLTAADIDTIVVATCSSADRCPNVATRVARNLGVDAPAAFDVNTACSGFSYALGLIDHGIRAGAIRNAIVIGAEKMSEMIDWSDRATCVIFADGAGAAVVSASDDATPAIGPVVWGSVPEKSDAIRVEGWKPRVAQEGQTVFRWATTALAPLARETCEKAGIDPTELAAFIPHQANTRIIDGIVKRLGLTERTAVAMDIVESGNTSAASVPMALSKMVERGEIPSGAPVLLFAFGGGLTYAGQVIRCP